MFRIVFLLAGLLVVTACVPVTTTYYAEAPIVTTGYVYQPYYYSQPYYRSYYRNNNYRNHNHNNYQRNRNHYYR